MICAPSASRPLKPKLQTRVEWTRQGVLTLLQRQAQLGCWHSYIGRTASRAKDRAYLMLVNVSLTLSADASDSAPSGKDRLF